MLGYIYTLTNESNGRSFSIGLNDDGSSFCSGGGGLALQENPTFEMDIRNSERDKTGQHGIWDFFSFYGKRSIVFQGVIAEDTHSDLIAKERLIQSVLGLPAQPVADTNDGYIAITWEDDEGIEWLIRAKLTEDVQFRRDLGQRTQARFFISMKAKDPVIVTNDEYQITQIRGWSQGIATFPMFLPTILNLAYNHVVHLFQKGNTDGPGRFLLYGPGTNPRVSRLDQTVSSETVLADMSEAWSGGTNDTVNILPGYIQTRKVSSVAGAAATSVLTGAFDLDFDDAYVQEETLSTCDNIVDFTTEGDATNLTLDTVNKQEGTGSAKFDIDVSLSGSNEGGLSRTDLTAVDLSAYEETYLEFDIYIPSIATFTGVRGGLGSSSDANGSYGTATLDSSGAAIAAGWNTVRIYTDDMSTDYGAGLEFGIVDSWDIRIQYSGGQVDMAGCRIDNVKVGGRIRRSFVELDCYIDDVDNLIIGNYAESGSYIKFIETEGVDEFYLSLSDINETLKTGWNKLLVLKELFDSVGAPSWGDITKIELGVKATGTSDLSISFGEIKVNNQEFTAKTIEVETTLVDGQYIEIDTHAGTVVDQDDNDLTADVTLASDWFNVKQGFNMFVYETDENPVTTFIDPTERFDVYWRDAQL